MRSSSNSCKFVSLTLAIVERAQALFESPSLPKQRLHQLGNEISTFISSNIKNLLKLAIINPEVESQLQLSKVSLWSECVKQFLPLQIPALGAIYGRTRAIFLGSARAFFGYRIPSNVSKRHATENDVYGAAR